jgi:hypothetical protein
LVHRPQLWWLWQSCSRKNSDRIGREMQLWWKEEMVCSGRVSDQLKGDSGTLTAFQIPLRSVPDIIGNKWNW